MKPTGNTVASNFIDRNSRFELQREFLKRGEFFKLICGAGNEDADEVYKLVLVYSLAGALGIDLSARREVVESAWRAIDRAEELAPQFGISRFVRPYLTVSVGMPGDHHVRKATIHPEPCTECNACIPVCPTEAIPASLVIIESRCIGCGACMVACQDDAVSYAHKEIEVEKVLRECIAAGAENIELHAAVVDHESTLEEWKLVAKTLPVGFLSVCVDRGYLSSHELNRRIEMMLEIAPDRMIVQADGIPMSGGRNDYKTTLEAVATASMVAIKGFPIHILLSGGTNAVTHELAVKCKVPYAGASLGTYARHLVYEWINDDRFPNDGTLEKAVSTAKELVSPYYTIQYHAN